MAATGAAGFPTESAAIEAITIQSIANEKDRKPSSNENSISMEKGEIYPSIEAQSEAGEGDELDPFSHEHPFPILPGEIPEEQQFTVRAVLVGCLLGAVISASK